MSQRNVLKENLAESARVLRERIGDRRPEVGMILGSGLGPLAGQIEDAVCVPYGEVPHMRTSTATSHVGRFVCGVLGGKCVLAMQGRLHGYEGNTAQEVAYPVWLMHELGVDTLLSLIHIWFSPRRCARTPGTASAGRRSRGPSARRPGSRTWGTGRARRKRRLRGPPRWPFSAPRPARAYRRATSSRLGP